MSLYTIFRSFLSARSSLSPACACYRQKLFSSKATHVPVLKYVDPDTGEVKRKKTAIVPKITLLSGDAITITTLAEAEKLSTRRNLRLVKIVDVDAKTQRPVYKLMTGSEYHSEDLKHREQRKKEKQSAYIKGEKVLLLNSRISEHDLQTQVNKAMKWVDKMYEVRVVISGGSNMDAAENVYSTFEKGFKNLEKDVKFVQKRQKGTDIKFQILPPKKNNDNNQNL